jgi:hypothetical protein
LDGAASYILMSKILDYNKLLTVLVKGDRSYTDGRHSFQHELLLRTLADAGVPVDEYALSEESQRRYEIRSAKGRARRAPRGNAYIPNKPYIFDVWCDSEKHFDAVFRDEETPSLPNSVRELHTPWDYKTEPKLYRFETYSRKAAAELLRYVRKMFPDHKLVVHCPGIRA